MGYRYSCVSFRCKTRSTQINQKRAFRPRKALSLSERKGTISIQLIGPYIQNFTLSKFRIISLYFASIWSYCLALAFTNPLLYLRIREGLIPT